MSCPANYGLVELALPHKEAKSTQGGVISCLLYYCQVESWLNTNLQDQRESHALERYFFSDRICELRRCEALEDTGELEDTGSQAARVDQEPGTSHPGYSRL